MPTGAFAHAVPATPPYSVKAARFYLLILAVSLLPLGVFLWVGSTAWFMRHNGYPQLRGIGYELTLRHADCEVVLYGDSSALSAYDPSVVERITGMTACNVSEGGTILSVVGPYPLDTYLRNNKRPRYLVMMFTPSLFRPSPPWMGGSEPEGYTYLLQYVRGWRLYYCLLRRPEGTLRYAAWVGERVIDDFFERHRGRNPDDDAKDSAVFRRVHGGLGTFPLPPEDHCIRTAFHYPAYAMHGDPAGVAEARRKYEVGGTRVLINVAPVPVCDELQDTYERVLAGEHDNRFERLPISWFNSEDVHLDAPGGRYLSEEVGNQILSDQAKASADGGGTMTKIKSSTGGQDRAVQ
jgi:hypothetical protein